MQDGETGRRVIPLEAGLPERLGWFIQLRWMAGAGVLFGVWVIVEWVHVPVPARPLYEVGLGVLACNGIFLFFSRRWARLQPPPQFWRGVAHTQIGADWMALSLLVLRSGGVRSPVAFAFIFHIIIAADLLPRRACYAHTVIAAALVGGIAATECAGWTVGPTLRYPGGEMQVVAQALFLIGTFGVAAFLGTAITNEVRRREWDLADSEQSLARACEQLEKLDRDKSRFALTVTHELRSPLATASSLLDTLSEGYAGPLTEKQGDLVRRARGRVRGLRILVNDLLDLAAGRTEMKARKVASVDLREVVRAAVDGLRGRAEAGGVALGVDVSGEPLAARADPSDVRLVLDNLLDNAIKYTPEGGRVEVVVRGSSSVAREKDSDRSRVTSHESPGGWVEVAVSDTGIGIPPEAISRVFEDFYRASNAKAIEAEGTGLGLSIVRGIVERYGGGIEVESEMGRGSRFVVRWPSSEAMP